MRTHKKHMLKKMSQTQGSIRIEDTTHSDGDRAGTFGNLMILDEDNFKIIRQY